MSDKNLYVRIGIIVLVITLSIWSIWPPSQQLKGGIDLVGGTSLLYEIDTAGLEERDKAGLAERVMSRLKNRVDPQGQRNLVWRPIGQNRLEIQMPRPPKELADRRKAYEAARDDLRRTRVDRGEVEAALTLTGAARDEAFAALVRDVPDRRAMFAELAAMADRLAAADAAARSRAAAATQTAPAAQTAPTTAADEGIDEVRENYYQMFERIAATNINLDKLSDVLALGAAGTQRAAKLAQFRSEYVERVAEAVGAKPKGATATQPGVKESLSRIEASLAPVFARIDRLEKAYDQWAQNKGALEDPSDLMRLLRGQGVLEFRILAERDPSNPEMIASTNPLYRAPISTYTENLLRFGPRRRPGDNFQWFKIGKPDEFKPAGNPIEQDYLGTKYVLAYATPDMGLLNDRQWQLTRAVPDRDQRGRWSVSFVLDARGGARFEKLTEANKGHPLCILLDGEAMSAPNIMSAIREHGQITGDFTLDEVTRLCNILEAGSLDARLKETPLSIKTIGPSLGEQNRRAGVQASVIALIAVVAFMAIYYLYGGVIADIALALNMLITLGIMAMIQGTFTLQGIAGLVLTLGMAVDANVLIFERIREEQARGVSLKTAVKLGYDRAFWVIFDSNLTTIISAIILGYVGTEEIKGFALTLGLGLCVSMFTALFVTRQFFAVLVQTRVSRLETQRCWGGAGVLAAAGGVLFAVGAVMNRRELWGESNLIGFAKFLGIAAASAIVLLGLMWIMRFVSIASGSHQTNRIPMLYLLKPTNVDWMGKQKYFWSASGVLTIGGLLLFALQPSQTLLDIEFLGGTAVQVTTESKGKPVTDADIEEIVKGTRDARHGAGWLNWAAAQLEAADVRPGPEPGTFLVGLAGGLTESQVEALLINSKELEKKVPNNWLSDAASVGGAATATAPGDAAATRPAGAGSWLVRVKDPALPLDVFRSDVLDAARAARATAQNVATSARVQSVQEYGAEAAQGVQTFEIVTTDTSKKLVSEAVLAALNQHGERFTLRIDKEIAFRLVTDDIRARDGAFAIQADDRELGDVIGSLAGPAARSSIVRAKGGVVMVFDQIDPPQTVDAVRQRIRNMRMQPDYERFGWRETDVIGIDAVGPSASGAQAPVYSRVAVVVSDENILAYENEDAWRRELAGPELQLARDALSSRRSLDKVTQFAPQVAAQAAQQATIAIILSFMAMVGYLWFRFGSMEFGLGAIIALIHDVTVALGLVVATHWLAKTFVGDLLLITETRIDLAVVAAFLTIIGYSVNDTIVVFDRIRENRGRLATLSPRLINDAINQTFPRTVLTAFTTFIVVLILYVAGGSGVHSFAFTMVIGTLVGCYSSIAIAAPVLYRPAVMRAMLAIIVLVLSVGLVIGGESKVERIVLAIVGLATLGLLGYWQYRKREEEARLAARMA